MLLLWTFPEMSCRPDTPCCHICIPWCIRPTRRASLLCGLCFMSECPAGILMTNEWLIALYMEGVDIHNSSKWKTCLPFDMNSWGADHTLLLCIAQCYTYHRSWKKGYLLNVQNWNDTIQHRIVSFSFGCAKTYLSFIAVWLYGPKSQKKDFSQRFGGGVPSLHLKCERVKKCDNSLQERTHLHPSISEVWGTSRGESRGWCSWWS